MKVLQKVNSDLGTPGANVSRTLCHYFAARCVDRSNHHSCLCERVVLLNSDRQHLLDVASGKPAKAGNGVFAGSHDYAGEYVNWRLQKAGASASAR